MTLVAVVAVITLPLLCVIREEAGGWGNRGRIKKRFNITTQIMSPQTPEVPAEGNILDYVVYPTYKTRKAGV